MESVLLSEPLHHKRRYWTLKLGGLRERKFPSAENSPVLNSEKTSGGEGGEKKLNFYSIMIKQLESNQNASN